MATITSITPYSQTATNGSGGNVAVPVGTGRKLIALFTRETTTSVLDAITFNGTAFFANQAVIVQSSANTSLGAAAYWYDIPDNVADGNYPVLFGSTANTGNRRMYCVMMTGAATGAPTPVDSDFLDGVGANITLSLPSVTADSVVIAGYANDGSTPTITWSGGTVVEDYDEAVGGNYRSSLATASAVSAGTKTITTTSSDSSSGREQVLIGLAVPNGAVGPTIDTQPTAQTIVLTNDTTASFTVAATSSGGSLSYDWELETGVASGVYANLADGNGATWTGQTAATATATLTAKTLSGRRVRCNVTDDNGTTTTDAVALTIFDGPQVTTFPPTDGSFESTATLTCDYVCGVGEVIEVAIPLADGTVAVSTVTTA